MATQAVPPATEPQQKPAQSVALTPLQRKFGNLKKLLETNNVSKQIEVALPRAIDPQRFLRIALTELKANTTLLECTPESVIGSIIQAAQLGLELDRQLGQGYLIPYKIDDGQGNKVWTCQFQPGYRGYIQLSRRSGEIKSLGAHVVHAGEMFEYEQGTESFLRHRPDVEFEDEDVTHVYAVVHYTNGGYDFEVMSVKAVEKVRMKSKAPNSPAWAQSWDEMAKAKVIRRLAKRLPVSAESAAKLVKAAVLDEQADAGVSQNNGVLLEADEHGNAFVPESTRAVGHDAGMAGKAADNLDGIKKQFSDPQQASQQPATQAAEPQRDVERERREIEEAEQHNSMSVQHRGNRGRDGLQRPSRKEIEQVSGVPLEFND